MAEITQDDRNRHLRNLKKLTDGNASDQQITRYLQASKVTVKDLRPRRPKAPLSKIDPLPFAVGGGMIGGTLGVPFGPAGVLGLGALGSQVGEQGVSVINQMFRGQKDPRGAVERMVDTTTGVAADVALPGAAGALGRGVRRGGAAVLNPVRNRLTGRGARETLGEFAEAGIPTAGNVGAITGNRAIQGAESALAGLPSSARTMQVAAAKTQQALSNELDRIVTGIGAARTKLTAGRQIIKGVKTFAGDIRKRGGEAFNKIKIDPAAPIPMNNTQKFIGEDLATFEGVEEIGEFVIPAQFTKIFRAIEKNGGSLNWEQLKRFRTSVGEKISNPMLINDASTAELRRFYGALSEDMGGAAKQAGGTVFRDWKRASAFWSASMKRLESVGRVIKSDVGEEAFNAATARAKDGPTLLNSLKKSLPKEQWGDFTAAMLHRMGLAKAGKQGAEGGLFSASTFLTNWNSLAPESKAVLFGQSNPVRSSLNRLARITGSLRDVDAVANVSGTGARNVINNILQGHIGASVGVIAGSPGLAAAGVATTLGLPLLTAKMMTNPRFVKWLANGIAINPTNFNGMAAHLGKLASVKAREPELTEDIERFSGTVLSLLDFPEEAAQPIPFILPKPTTPPGFPQGRNRF